MTDDMSLVEPSESSTPPKPCPTNLASRPAPPWLDRLSSTHDIAVNLSMPLLLLDDGDTLVYVDPVPATPGRSSTPASIPHRVHSQRLLETGSEFFQNLFQPRMQQRIIKRRGLAGNLPPQIKYVLDLTPPSAEDEAVVYLMELSCPLGVRTWAQSMQHWGLPKSCVGGVDETEWIEKSSATGGKASQPRSPQSSASQRVSSRDSAGSNVDHVSEKIRRILLEQEEQSMDESTQTKTYQMGLPLDYSPARHRTAIDRILHALEGLHPKLDTACKMWTFFALAKIFGVAHAPQICDNILPWLYELSNCRFVEVNPEISYRIACGIECGTLCRDTFAILVGEEALRLANPPDAVMGTQRPTVTIHGRVREGLDDTEVQRIEYASKSFMDHVLGRFTYLIGSEMPWLFELPEFRRIQDFHTLSPSEETVKGDLVRLLKIYVRRILYGALKTRQLAVRSPGFQWHAEDQRHREHLNDVYHTLRFAQRVLTKTYWIILSQGWVWDSDNLYVTVNHSNVAAIGPDLPMFHREADASLHPITLQSLRVKVEEFSVLRRRRGCAEPVPGSEPRDCAGDAELPVASSNAGSLLGRDDNQPSVPNTVSAKSPLMFDSEAARQRPQAQASVLATSDTEEQGSSETATWDTSVENNKNNESDTFRLDRFRAQVDEYVGRFAMEMLQSPESEEQAHRLMLGRDDTLTCLTANEFKFLPLWAGGNDDGSGGVFIDQDVPIVESGGFSGPGPAIHMTASSRSAASSVGGSFSVIDGSEYNSTVHGASHHATDGFTETEVRSIDSVVDTASEEGGHGPSDELDSTSPPQWAELDRAYDDMLSDASDTVGNRSVDGFYSDGEDDVPLYSDDQDFHEDSDE